MSFGEEGFEVVKLRFWLDDDYGIIRQRRAPGLLWHPQLWHDGRWVVGSPYVMDAITGGSDHGWWGCPSAEPLGAAEAAEYAARHGVELLADNPDDPHEVEGPASLAEERPAEPERCT
jgi:hypothetical protein